MPPDQLQRTEGALIVFREAQDVVDWSILLGDDVAPDPPVYLTNREVSPARRIEASSVSGFLVQMATLLVKFSPRVSFRANGPATDEAVLALHDELARLPQPKLHWPANTIHLGEENLIVEINDDDWIWVSALSPDAFRRACDICQEHGVSWEHIERADGSDGV